MSNNGVPCDDQNSNNNDQCIIREQDRFMPIANVIRIMRKILPSHAKISDDAKETIQECVSEYISFITSEANDRCQKEQRKTITAEDILWAMSTLGFDDYIEPLTLYLHRYREFDGCDRAGSSSSSSSSAAMRGADLHPVMVKRPAVDPPPSTFHFLHPPPRHHQQFYHGGPLISTQMAATINGTGGFHHVKLDGSNGGGSTSQAAAANGASGRLAPTPKDK